jgi:hypothetical protein
MQRRKFSREFKLEEYASGEGRCAAAAGSGGLSGQRD